MIFHTAQYHHPISPRLVHPTRPELMWNYQQTLKHFVVNLEAIQLYSKTLSCLTQKGKKSVLHNKCNYTQSSHRTQIADGYTCIVMNMC